MFEKIALPKASNRFPVVFITGESITNTKNSTNISGRASLHQEKLVDEKNGDENLVIVFF
jgi:hypothetical protein